MASSRKTPAPDLLARVGQCLTRLLDLQPAMHLCVGFSGGLDSVVLLHLLTMLRKQHGFILSAVHVHHGLSPNADLWSRFAAELAAKWQVSCRIEHVQVRHRAELGVEAAARQARYAVFEQQPCDALLLAQHRNDQAETVLLNLLRGSGLNGLSAMPYSRQLARGRRLLRPLLDEPRQALLDYAQAHDLHWVEDESNADPGYDRNFLRLRIFPELETAFPGASRTLARVAHHAAESAELLAELAELDLAVCVSETGFDLIRSAALSEPRKRNALRHWLARQKLVLDTRAFDELLAMMENASPDAEPVFIWRDRAVRRYRGHLWVTPARLQAGEAVTVSWLGGQSVPVPQWHGVLHWQRVEQGGLAESCLDGVPIELRPRSGGERLRLRLGGPSRSLKHLWQEAAVAPWLRDTTPLLWLNHELAAVPGLGVDAAFSGPGWLPVFLPGLSGVGSPLSNGG